jgi:hypothetical protein
MNFLPLKTSQTGLDFSRNTTVSDQDKGLISSLIVQKDVCVIEKDAC